MRRAALLPALVALCATGQVRAQEPPGLRILGAQGADSTVKRLFPTAHVSHTVIIQSLADEPLAMSVTVGPFVDLKGESFPTTVLVDNKTERTATLPPSGSVSLTVVATLPREAEYSAEVTLSAGGARQVARLVAIRATEPLAVAFLPLDPVRGAARPVGESSARMMVALEETSGRTITLKLEVVSFAMKEGVNLRQAEHELEVNGNKAVAVPGHGTVRVPLHFIKLEGAGEYAGTLRISAPGMTSLDKPVSLFLREPGWMAFVCIFIGSLLSLGIRWVVTKLRPRLVARQRLERIARFLRERSADPLNDEEDRAVVWELRAAVVARLEAVVSGAAGAGDAAIEVLEKKHALAEIWIRRRREIRGVEPPEARAELEEALDTARAAIASTDPTGKALEDARTALDQIPAAARAAVKKALSARVDEMRADVRAVMADPARAIGPPASTEVMPFVENARGALDANDMDRALAAYEEARTRWLVLLLRDLEELLGDMPPGFEADAWKEETAVMAREIAAARGMVAEDPDAAMVRYRGARARYLASVAAGLVRAIDEVQDMVEKAPLDPKDRQTLTTRLVAGRAEAEKARMAAATGKPDDALPLLQTARDAWLEAHNKVAPRRLGDEAAHLRLRAVAPAPRVTDLRAVPWASLSAVDIAPSSRWITAIDGAAMVLALLIASVLGLNVLWAADATWGGWTDYTAAVLWGLGLQGATQSGVQAVAEKLVGPKP